MTRTTRMKLATVLGAVLVGAGGGLASAPLASAANSTPPAAGDQDGDGLSDSDDACPSDASASASGCPVAERSLTMTYRKGVFRGELTSNVDECKYDDSAVVWRVHKGPDLKVGTGWTGADGKYKVKEARTRGTYYATSRRLVVPDVAECPEVRSAKLQLR